MNFYQIFTKFWEVLYQIAIVREFSFWPILSKKRTWGKQRRKWLQLLTSLCNLRSYTSPACKFPIFAAVLSFTLVAYQLFWEHLQYVSFVYPRGRKAVRALKRWPQWELIKMTAPHTAYVRQCRALSNWFVPEAMSCGKFVLQALQCTSSISWHCSVPRQLRAGLHCVAQIISEALLCPR